ncbi:hypothetical protein LSH36_356g02043 [Paralvinella palmiformis]|uniref:Uncharacterized protein n=1 Tax=Paralvinella palmiformis TaxID=53620 RepID=A0AAD9JFE6_9ANNE|nr:hypothetical protein LSH36_356g02043 [Paralvinella palmiformis]
MFRQLCRKRVDQVNTDYFHDLNETMQQNNTPRFWKTVKQGSRSSRHCNPPRDIKSLSHLYRSVMTDSGSSEFIDGQLRIKDTVSRKYNTPCGQKLKFTIYSDKLEKCINKQKRNSSPGMNSVTSEYLINGNPSHLCSCLASLYPQMLKHNCVPACFNTGMIIPILKEATLDPNIPEHYRRIT